MINQDTQSHQLPGEQGLLARVQTAGYNNVRAVGENVYAYSQDALHGHAGFVVDWGYDDADFDNGSLRPNWQSIGDGIQDSAGHRENIMSATYTEIGIGVIRETNPATNVGEYVTTQNFGARFGYAAQFVGVVTNDADGDQFYDIGEGLGGITVAAFNGTTTYTTTTWSSGGWQSEVPPANYNVTFPGAALNGGVVKSAVLGSSNVKLDARAQDALPDPSSGATNGDDDLIGSGLSSNATIQGNLGAGSNDLINVLIARQCNTDLSDLQFSSWQARVSTSWFRFCQQC